MKKSARSSSPLVRDLFAILDATQLSAGVIAARAGVHDVTMSRWKHGLASPRLSDFENVAQVLGYRIVLQPSSTMTNDTDGRASPDQAE